MHGILRRLCGALFPAPRAGRAHGCAVELLVQPPRHLLVRLLLGLAAESSDDAGTELEVVCLGLGEGFTREGLGVGGFDRGLGLSHRSGPSSDAADCTRAVLPGKRA